MLYEPVKWITGIPNIFHQAIGASQKVFEYLDRVVQIEDKPRAATLAGFSKSIVFDKVTFRYPNSPGGFLLNGISLEVNAGQVIALVRPSGTGKTTLANLVPRFYHARSGSVPIHRFDHLHRTVASL